METDHLFLTRFHNDERGQSDGLFVAFVAGCIIAVIALIVFIFTATYESVPPDKVALHYTGGPIDGTRFVSVVEPGSGAKFYGLSENLYMIPATTRNYIISKNVDEGDEKKADFITAPSKAPENVSFTFEGAVYFTVNTDPAVIKQFFEQVCLHSKCYTGDGWDKMLRQFFRKPLELAIAQEAKKYDKDSLYSDPATLAKMNKAISAALADDINRTLGFKAFCGPRVAGVKCSDMKVIIKNPTPPQSVIDAYNATAAAKQSIKTAEQQAIEAKTEAKGKADAVREAAAGARDAQNTRAGAKTLTLEQLEYIRAQALATCAANTNCTIFYGGTGAVSVTGK